eukprot:1139617-Pelagomonas_calceolata.AAC.4
MAETESPELIAQTHASNKLWRNRSRNTRTQCKKQLRGSVLESQPIAHLTICAIESCQVVRGSVFEKCMHMDSRTA